MRGSRDLKRAGRAHIAARSEAGKGGKRGYGGFLEMGDDPTVATARACLAGIGNNSGEGNFIFPLCSLINILQEKFVVYLVVVQFESAASASVRAPN